MVTKNLISVKPRRYVYHTSNPHNRDKIAFQGLIPMGKSDTWLEGTKIKGKVIFAVNSKDKTQWWDSTYDDDIYRIDTQGLDIQWFNDPNFNLEENRIITFEKIPVDRLKLIYKGTGK